MQGKDLAKMPTAIGEIDPSVCASRHASMYSFMSPANSMNGCTPILTAER
jgi:hypothetical protein